MNRSVWLLLAVVLTFSPALFAVVEVPVAYTLTAASKPTDGVLTGGSLCEPEGISLTTANASSPQLFAYETIDRLEAMALSGKDQLAMVVVLRDGNRFRGFAKVTDTEPILILCDEVASATPAIQPKVRTFTKANFKGIAQIVFEAEPVVEFDAEDLKTAADDMVKAVEAGDIERAIDLHSKIGDYLESLDEENGGPEEKSPGN